MIRFAQNSLVFFLMLLLSGCGNQQMADEAESVEVSGVVKLDGKPLREGENTFLPADGDPLVGPALVITDQEGKYSMSVNAPREYIVNVDRMMNGAPNPALKAYQGEASSLKADVSSEKKTFDFELTSAK